MNDEDLRTVSGSLAGLCCARRLAGAGVAFQVLKAADTVGGSARTDRVEGFLLDLGSQVLLTAYPEAQRTLVYQALHRHRFEPGALIQCRGRFQRLVDRWQRSEHVLATTSFLGLHARRRAANRWPAAPRASDDAQRTRGADQPEQTRIKRLREEGTSNNIIERFFRPFLGGVLHDHDSETASRLFDFVFRMFADGDAVLPAQAMGSIAQQLTERLPPGTNSTISDLDRIL